jgi:hypothetical protein
MGTYITTNYFKDIFSLLKSIKKIGGSCIKNNITPMLTKKNLSAINCYFEHTKRSAALPLTYEISFFIVREI